MTVAEAINRACDEAEKFDEACRIARQQAEAINELCAWTDELKAYRETGLTPEEVTALQASNQELKKEALPILQAKVQDRLVILPCGLGETVYANFAIRGDYLREKDKPYPCEVVFIGLSKEPFLHIQFKNGRVFPVKFCEVGKTVFTTREAAEAALKEQEG
ncbi:hypothetical protein D3Z52_08100 [Clostridiaceae bacterium]|nr:hypothetical protein [Clostridiaceae bacterium]